MEIQLWEEILHPYELAVNEITLKFKNMKKEYKRKGIYCPIQTVEGRVKSVASILEKAQKKKIPFEDIDFEGIKVMSLKDGEKFLKMQYGDYTSLPLLHQRVGHDLIRFSVDEKIASKYHIYED